MTYAVIMAGGIGSRFWPRSRKARPKQFLNVFGDATLIQNTVARLQGLVPPERCYVVTHERYREQTQEQLPAVPAENILAEPVSRNTAPCILYAAEHLYAQDPDATMVVLPADHVIRNVKVFHETLETAIEKAQEPRSLVTIGINPTHPATGYGYIQYDQGIEGDGLEARPVRTFAEKPDIATAERFLDCGDFLWNSGMFVWRAESIRHEIQDHLSDTYEAFEPVRREVEGGETAERDTLEKAFLHSQAISIDYGVMERAENVYVVPASFGWSDVGDWRAVYDLSDKNDYGNVYSKEKDVLLHDSSRCLVLSEDGAEDERLVALVGMHDTVVVETDDALLICNRESAQQVKNVVEYLHANQLERYV